jgi:hypothetical protein
VSEYKKYFAVHNFTVVSGVGFKRFLYYDVFHGHLESIRKHVSVSKHLMPVITGIGNLNCARKNSDP